MEDGGNHPSRLASRFLQSPVVFLHAMHSVVDWCAFAKWVNGKLVRSLSLAPDHGVIESIGPKLKFEIDYWTGKHPASDDPKDKYPFPFHPLELGEAALTEFFGYQLEGVIDRSMLDPETIPLLTFRR